MLYERVIEAQERVAAHGETILNLDAAALTVQLQQAYSDGLRSCAIVFLHGYRYTHHELSAANIAHDIGFTQVSVSHRVSPLMKLVPRGDTAVVDAYLSPILRRYCDKLAELMPGVPLFFMRSSGGLTRGQSIQWQGRDSVRPCRRNCRHGAHGSSMRTCQADRLRYGWHLDGRQSLCRRV